MNAFRTLLAATDLSAPARHAVLRAGLLAAECGAELVLLHVVDQRLVEALRRVLGKAGAVPESQLLDAAAQSLADLAEEVQRRCGLRAVTELRTGEVLPEIVGCANRISTDLIVLGARGAEFVPEWLLGSTAERVLRMSRHPVLIVKQTPHRSYREILVPVDFAAQSRRAIDLARGLAPTAALRLLHAFVLPFERKLHYAGVTDVEMIELQGAARNDALREMSELQCCAGGSGPTRPPLVLPGSPALRILEQAQDCDLIVIGRGGEGRLSDGLLGSTTKRVLALAGCDLLVANFNDGAAHA